MKNTLKLSITLIALTTPFALTPAYAMDKDENGHKGQKHHGPMFTFEEADSNNDGFLTQEEIHAAKEAAKKKKKNERFKKIDSDGDGKLSKEEWESIKDKMKEKQKNKDQDDD